MYIYFIFVFRYNKEICLVFSLLKYSIFNNHIIYMKISKIMCYTQIQEQNITFHYLTSLNINNKMKPLKHHTAIT